MIIDIQRYWGTNEIFFPGELSSKIIQGMIQDGKVVLRSKEVRSATDSGLYFLLDQLVYNWKWDKKDITLETGNIHEAHPEYNIQLVGHRWDPSATFELDKIKHEPWDRSYLYGMFIGRASAARIRGSFNHRNFEFRQHGLTSFNHDLTNSVDLFELVDYMIQTNQRYSDIVALTPYSDINKQPQSVPIVGQLLNETWNQVYKKIPIEIVFETNDRSIDCYALTEKLFRVMIYKRPFILIAAAGTQRQMKTSQQINSNLTGRQPIWIPTINCFDRFIPEDFDSYSGVHRVDYAFDILHNLIASGKIYSIIDDCQNEISENYNTAVSFLSALKESSLLEDNKFCYSDWELPEYYNGR